MRYPVSGHVRLQGWTLLGPPSYLSSKGWMSEAAYCVLRDFLVQSKRP